MANFHSLQTIPDSEKKKKPTRHKGGSHNFEVTINIL